MDFIIEYLADGIPTKIVVRNCASIDDALSKARSEKGDDIIILSVMPSVGL